MNAFEIEWQRTLQNIEGLWTWRIPDTHAYQSVSERYLLPKVPADFLSIFNGIPIFWECKSTHNRVSFNLDFISHHQLIFAEKIVNHGGIYYFVLNCRAKRKHFFVYLIPFQKLTEIKSYISRNNRKSMKWVEFENFSLTKLEKIDNVYRPDKISNLLEDLACSGFE